MNYYDARQLKLNGKWHYTVENDGHTCPVGYCADGCPGHATAEEAREHYRHYVIDKCQIKGPKPENSWPKNKCQIHDCQNEATYLLDSGTLFYYEVCKDHANKSSMEILIPSIGQITASY